MNYLFILIFLAFSFLSAEEDPLAPLLRDAETYFYAEQFSEAEKSYREAINFPQLTNAQTEVLYLNLGMVLVQDQRYQEAIETLQKIKKEGSPVVRKRGKLLMAVALERKVLETFEELDPADEGFEKELGQALIEIGTAFLHLSEAEEIDRDLAKIEGRDPEERSREISLLYNRIKELFVLLKERLELYKLDKLELKELFPLLLERSYQLIDSIEQLALHPGISEQQISDYLGQFYISEEENRSLWERGREKVGELSEEEREKGELFFPAEEGYLKGLDLMEEKRVWRARSELGKGTYHLTVLSSIFGEEDLFSKALQFLIAHREKALTLFEERELLEILFSEDQNYQQLAEQVVKEIQKQQVGLEQNDQTKRAIALLEILIQKVEESAWNTLKRDRLESVKEAPLYNYLFYQYIQVDEKKGLYSLYRSLMSERELEKLRWQVEFLVEDFKFLKESGSERGEAIEKVLGILGGALTTSSRERFADLIEQALLIWAPKYYTLASYELLYAELLKLIKNRFPTDLAEKILSQYSQLEEVVQTIEDSDVQQTVDNFLRSKELAIKGEDHLRAGELKHASLFFDTSKEVLLSSIDELKGKEISSPQEILQAAIDRQKRTDSVFGKIQNLGEHPDLTALLSFEQLLVNKIASLFVPSIKKMGQEGEEQVCTSPPWSEALPPFHRGYDLAEKNYRDLAGNIYNTQNLDSNNREIIDSWEEALKKIQENSSDQKEEEQQSDPESGESKQENEQSSQEEQQDQGERELEQDLLQMLMEMDRDDQEEKSGNKKPKTGLRPW